MKRALPSLLTVLALVLMAPLAACGQEKEEKDLTLELISTEFDEAFLTVTVRAGAGINQFRINGLKNRLGGDEYVIVDRRTDDKYVAKVPLERLLSGPQSGKLFGVNDTPQSTILEFQVEVPTNLQVSRAEAVKIPEKQRLQTVAFHPADGGPAFTGILDLNLQLHVAFVGSPGVKATLGNVQQTFDGQGHAVFVIPLSTQVGQMDLSGLVQGRNDLKGSQIVFPTEAITLDLSHGDEKRSMKYQLGGETLGTHAALALATAYAKATKMKDAPAAGGALLAVDGRGPAGHWGLSRDVTTLNALAKIGVAEEVRRRFDCGTYVNEQNNSKMTLDVDGVTLSATVYRAGRKPEIQAIEHAGRKGCRSSFNLGGDKAKADATRDLYPSNASLQEWLSR